MQEQTKLESPDVVAVSPQDAHVMRQLFGALHQAGNNYRAGVYDMVCEYKLNPNEYTYDVGQGAFVKKGAVIPPTGDGPKADNVRELKKRRRRAK